MKSLQSIRVLILESDALMIAEDLVALGTTCLGDSKN